MESESSLALDVESVGYRDAKARVVRIAVVGVQGVTRDGSASTITRDCQSLAELAREVDRLREELEVALESARAALGGEAGAGATPRKARHAAPPAAAAAADALHLELDATVAELMTRDVKTVGANDPLSTARDAMQEGRFRHLVVLGDESEIEGVLSQRDFFFGPLAWSLGQGEKAYESLLANSHVKEVMHADVATVEASTPLQEAASMLVERKIGCLPVVEAGRLVGLVTEGDFVQLVAHSVPQVPVEPT